MNSIKDKGWEHATDAQRDRGALGALFKVLPRAFLVTLAGDQVGKIHDLKPRNVIGRRNDVDISLSDQEVSRKHAEIRVEGTQALVTDLGSRNGTFVNDRPVQELPLKHGDLVRLGGGTVLKFTWGDEVSDGMSRFLTETSQKLNVTSEQLQSAQQRLVQAEKFAAIGQLASGVGHEILNPLSFVIHNLSFIKNELAALRLEQDHRADLEGAINDAGMGVERIRVIVSDLQDFARQMHDERKPIDLKLVIEAAVLMVAHQIEPAARMKVEIAELPQVEASALRLEQVFTNLLVNALHAIEGPREANQITLRAYPFGDLEVVIEVEDTGRGIPAESLKRVFDPYFSTRPSGTGLGLGLSICQGIVSAHRGQLMVESEVGKGTLFQVLLPVYRPPPVKAEEKHDLTAVKVMLVGTRTETEAQLSSMALASLTAVRGVDEALTALSSGERPDVIFCESDLLSSGAGLLHQSVNDRFPNLAPRLVFLGQSGLELGERPLLDRVGNPRLPLPLDLERLPGLLLKWLRLWED